MVSVAMAIQGFLDKLRPYKTVLKRTSNKQDFAFELLYVEWLAGESKRKLLDRSGGEHTLADKDLLSHYKVATGSAAKKLIKEHWPDANPHKQAK